MSKYPEGLQLESRPCPIGCEPNDTLVLEGSDRIHRIPGIFKVVRCGACGLMRTDPRPTPSTIGAYYPDDYGPYAVAAAPVKARPSSFKSRVRRLLKIDARRTPPVNPGRLLELGCASGGYLEAMRDAGWTAEGVEFSDTAAQRARDKGFKVQTSSVEEASVQGGGIDLVAAWMVLEHLHDPVGALRKIRGWVKPDGYFAFSIPLHSSGFLRMAGSASYDLHLPNHLYHFNRATVERMLNEAGWKVENVFWQRNANTLLWTLEYKLGDRGARRLTSFVRWFRTAASMEKPRMLLGWMLGITRTSGRVEVWARPTS